MNEDHGFPRALLYIWQPNAIDLGLLGQWADVALDGITRLSSKEARTDKRTMASSQFCWLLSPALSS